MTLGLSRFAVRVAVVTAFASSLFAACGGGDNQSGSKFGSSGSGGSTTAGVGGESGSIINADGSGGTTKFDSAGGTAGIGGGGGNGQGGAPCVPANCPPPPAPAMPCCIIDMCGGDWGAGCQPFFNGSGGGAPVDHYCNQPPPPGAQLAAAPPGYAGTCPAIVTDGTKGGMITITSSGAQRRFFIGIPQGLQPSEQLPVVFLWHWIGGDGTNFFNKANAGVATNQQRFIAVFPEAKDDNLPFRWPSDFGQSQGRYEEELRFFDDMYACIAQQFNVQPNCISTAGMSAGGLWTPQLYQGRSQYIASFSTFSGGTGLGMRGYLDPPHKAAALVLWGGPSDHCPPGYSFESTSRDLQSHLGGHFQIECIHNCNHSEPPFDGIMGFTKYAVFWNFVFDHPYWLGAGQSPYSGGLPAAFPSWCSIGANTAAMRSGPCQIPSQCL